MNKLLLEYLQFIKEMPIQRFEPESLEDMNNKEKIMKSKTIRKDFHHWHDADKRGLHNLRIVNKIKNTSLFTMCFFMLIFKKIITRG